MSANPPLLISFELCPFVQRSLILLQEKGVDHEIRYIDLANKPDWFLAISPLGKVPVMQVEGKSIFESAVIAEYLDEVYPPSMHPADPLDKAINRAWVEFTSSLFMAQYGLCMAPDEQTFQAKQDELEKGLERLEGQMGEGPYFNGAQPALIDFAAAPLFQRMGILTGAGAADLLGELPNLNYWASSLLSRPSVGRSVPPQFGEKYVDYIKKSGSYLARTFLGA